MINIGRNLHMTGFSPKSNKTTHPLMGETFRAAGYETFITGKWHVGNDALKRYFTIGRAVHEGGMAPISKGGQWQPWLTDFGEDIKWAKKQKNQHTSEAFADAVRDDLIMATGRSDYPNQVNNVLCFRFIFRGALDVRASTINDEMKIAAVYAISAIAKEPVPAEVLAASGEESLTFGRGYIIPKPMDPRLCDRVASAVAKAAIDSGVARLPKED